ncbi:MAG: FMN-binding negative transcriptional regulator [Burkholderiales bacterium]|nr:FMN-binding negative transcriptional regulator [Burkholderiales bacterium]
MTLYVPAHFRADDPETLARFIEANGFATLVSQGAGGLQVSHVPLLAERAQDGQLRLLGHVARANEHWKGLEDAAEVLAIFHGPHAYVSPTWYVNHPSVPTWNYAVVHARGKARLMEEAELHDLLMRLSSVYESPNPKPWRMSELPAAYVDGMLKMIVGFEIEVERLEGKFKLSQNRPAEVARVIEALEARGEAGVASLMREHAPGAKG